MVLLGMLFEGEGEMTEDWSLKESVIIETNGCDENGFIRRNIAETKIYFESDIETLRTKILELIDRKILAIRDESYTTDVELEKDYQVFLIEGLRNDILKLFGVK